MTVSGRLLHLVDAAISQSVIPLTNDTDTAAIPTTLAITDNL
jgi:hypothetical protein